MIGRRVAVWVAVSAVLAAVVLLCGCGTTSETQTRVSPVATASSVKLNVVKNTTYGFRVAYPAGWVMSDWTKGQSTQGDDDDSALRYMVAYADPDGAEVDGTYLDAEQICIYQLSKSIQPRDLTESLALTIISGVALRDVTRLDVRSDGIVRTTVHGSPAWRVVYRYEIDGASVWATSTLIANGKHAYWITIQASAKTWYRVSATLSACFDRFDLL